MIKVSRLLEEKVHYLDVQEVQDLLSELRTGSAVEKVTLGSLAQYAKKNHLFVAREENGKIVGMTTLAISFGFAGKRGDVRDVVVAETHRRQGIARQLMNTVIEFANSERLPNLKLTSSDGRREAHQLYESLGFSQYGKTNKFVLKLS